MGQGGFIRWGWQIDFFFQEHNEKHYRDHPKETQTQTQTLHARLTIERLNGGYRIMERYLNSLHNANDSFWSLAHFLTLFFWVPLCQIQR